MLSEKTLREINHHCNPDSLLAVTVNKLMRLKCPFYVRCIMSVGNIRKGQIAEVDKVLVTKQHLLIYEIDGKLYSYKSLRIV